MHRPLIIALLFVSGFAAAEPKDKDPSSLTGWFEIVWADDRRGPGVADENTKYFLTTDDGERVSVELDEVVARKAGGVLKLNRRRVKIAGVWAPGRAMAGTKRNVRANHIQRERSLMENPTAPDAISGPQPWVSVLCRFQDIATEQQNTTYFQNMYANSYPGMDHYWREQSYNIANVAGSGVAGWFSLPHPRSFYIYDNNADGVLDADLESLATDCIAAGNPTVNYSTYVGINMMFNADLDCCAWGGGRFMNLDGVEKTWRVTWDPPWAFGNIAVIGHEMGHGFGLPHSSGMYGATYDNAWDVMSDTWTNCANSSHATYGCLGQHTISRHKDQLEWIPAGNKFVAPPGVPSTITLEQLALPQTGNYRIAQIPIGGSSTHFYTVEVRRRVGYDVQLPGEGVIIHEVDLNRQRPANVVDADGNGNTGDNGARWVPGETFNDLAAGISVHVDSATATGYMITISPPSVPAISIGDAAVTEGNAGTTNAVFTATLSASSASTVTVKYETADNTAVGGKVGSITGAIAIPSSGNATPYPSTINVSGVAGTVDKVTVTLTGLMHTWPEDIDALLVGPGGQSVILMSDAGGSDDVSGLTITFDDAAAPALGVPLASGTYHPTNIAGEADVFSAPAPAGGYGAALSVFNGTSPNGNWNLYLVDDVTGDLGSVTGGWTLAVSTTGGDYIATAGTLVFDPGVTVRTISVPVRGDATGESNETFFVNLSGAVEATISDAQGIGTITNDDGLMPPTNVVATATSTTTVNVTWTAAAGASSYRVYRSSGGGIWGLVGSPASSPFNDAASPNTAYLYLVRSFAGSESADSNRDLATTSVFMDPSLTPNVTIVKAAHFTQLLTAVNAVRVLAGQPTIAFTAPTPATNVTIRRQHLLDLRGGLDAARSLLTLPALSYTDPSITAGVTKVKASHVAEVRAGTQ